MTGSLTHLTCDFHSLCILTLLCSFIENSKASLYGICNIGKSFFYRLTLGVAAGKNRGADNNNQQTGLLPVSALTRWLQSLSLS